jgi:hypothetical protein
VKTAIEYFRHSGNHEVNAKKSIARRDYLAATELACGSMPTPAELPLSLDTCRKISWAVGDLMGLRQAPFGQINLFLALEQASSEDRNSGLDALMDAAYEPKEVGRRLWSSIQEHERNLVFVETVGAFFDSSHPLNSAFMQWQKAAFECLRGRRHDAVILAPAVLAAAVEQLEAGEPSSRRENTVRVLRELAALLETNPRAAATYKTSFGGDTPFFEAALESAYRLVPPHEQYRDGKWFSRAQQEEAHLVARRIMDNGDYADLGVLADNLQDRDIDPYVRAHLRNVAATSSTWTRPPLGSWVVDQLVHCQPGRE